MNNFHFDYYLEPYAVDINTFLPVTLIMLIFSYLSLRLHLITRVTPRVDQCNGFKTTRRFKINHHQSAVYRRCFTASDLKLKNIFKAQPRDRFLFQCEKFMGPAMIIVTSMSCLFLRYTHTLVF